MALHAQMQRLGALQQQEGIERRQAGAGIAQALHPRLEDERERPERLGVGDAVIRRIGLGEILEAAGGLPVELARVDDDAADRGAVPADELGRGVDDDVGSPLDRPAQRRRGGGVVDDERQAVFVRDVGQLLDVGTSSLGLPSVSV